MGGSIRCPKSISKECNDQKSLQGNPEIIHFCDNANIYSGDKCGKVRPLIELIQERCKKYGSLTKTIDVDESMIPYFGNLDKP